MLNNISSKRMGETSLKLCRNYFIIFSVLFFGGVVEASSLSIRSNNNGFPLFENSRSNNSDHSGRGFPIYAKEKEAPRNIGLPQTIDLDDLPVSGLSPEQARDLLFERYRARMLELHDSRMLHGEDLTGKEIGEICGSSASLECGKEVLKYSDYSEDAAPSVSIHLRCTLRKEFLDCIDVQRIQCRLRADEGIFPRMPPKSLVRAAQSKIWRALWTSGGCTLVN